MEKETLIYIIALACWTWYFFILLVQAIGSTQLFRYYSSVPKPAISPNLDSDDIPHITILRPVKGLEPQLYECLAATFRQTYPTNKLTIYFCVGSSTDPAFPVLQRLLADFPEFDAKVFIEEEDPNLSGHGGEIGNLGPNPKIRNMSRGYREAKGDIVWILDCNVWVGTGTAGRMVDKLCGLRADGTRITPYKFVHLLPLVVDTVGTSTGGETEQLLTAGQQITSTNSMASNITNVPKNESNFDAGARIGGGRFEESFMASSHAKFYTAINTVLFSGNICEDHLIGDLLWRKQVPEEEAGERWHKHGLVPGDLAIQPMAGMSVREYIARRVRWLRVRKWTVTLATFVEPGVEPLLCSAYGSFAITTLPWFHENLSVPQTWLAFALVWLSNVAAWMTLDWFVYAHLHSGASIELDANTPSFARPPQTRCRRPFKEWASAWLGREILALPIWTWACLGGTTVMWRGKKFRVNLDMKVIEIKGEKKSSTPEIENGRAHSKDRQD
ncbi:uncharacterized protein EAF02_007197 [Botrytis sinoallii]|uniref:uncharacterized protein n=1 Tax=Botrytis sinoallii TaxID=1463999 RepID=UPI0018FF4560|nr:uncharacterized protein EAF02_007197 [Botrytis sinoallii]KAF7880351.1 hypothetical protein EAF02_007197 [Botrytis sinoallii]